MATGAWTRIGERGRRWAVVATAIIPAMALAGGQERDVAPFRRTEHREPCASYAPLRQPFFGELHIHTQYSSDAATLDTRNTPRDAYRFARGEVVGLSPFVNTCTGPGPGCPFTVDGGPVSDHPYCLPPARCEYTATRTVQLPPGRKLDFAAITDHSEWLGETNICFWEEQQPCTTDSECPAGQFCLGGTQPPGAEVGLPGGTHLPGPLLAARCVPRGYESESCVLARDDVSRLTQGIASAMFASYVTAETGSRLPFCAEPGAGGDPTCIFQAKNVWQQIIADAEEAYDRTSRCSFTSFVAYEYSSMPAMGQCAGTHAPCFDAADCGGATCEQNPGGGNNLHRNIIFRNANVPTLPLSGIEAPTGCGKGATCQSAQGGALGSPVGMLTQLRSQCNDATGCDFLSIPHNSNLSGGAMFLMPESDEEARVRGALEPLVEMLQIKGSSECRYSAAHPGAWGTVDEFCNFENMSFAKLGGPFIADPTAADILPGSYVRNALKLGIQYDQAHGVNPFHLGFVGGLDTHNGTPGQSDEVQYAKASGHGDNSFIVSGQALNETYFLGAQTNGGSLTVVWAEENSRDSLFAAMQRRETYATSGTRPIVRFFGGFDLPRTMCKAGDFAASGYGYGVPMGGTLTGGQQDVAPTFAVAASWDPGWPGHDGTKLQRIQIVKGWVDAQGEAHEAVLDVAGGDTGASVDPRTCQPVGRGYTDLCAEWTDPAFDSNQHAFYYARVLENPSCRWNQYYCASRGIDCSKPSRAADEIVGYTEYEYQQCCSNVVPSTVQQRAWTSPIWFRPGR